MKVSAGIVVLVVISLLIHGSLFIVRRYESGSFKCNDDLEKVRELAEEIVGLLSETENELFASPLAQELMKTIYTDSCVSTANRKFQEFRRVLLSVVARQYQSSRLPWETTEQVDLPPEFQVSLTNLLGRLESLLRPIILRQEHFQNFPIRLESQSCITKEPWTCQWFVWGKGDAATPSLADLDRMELAYSRAVSREEKIIVLDMLRHRPPKEVPRWLLLETLRGDQDISLLGVTAISEIGSEVLAEHLLDNLGYFVSSERKIRVLEILAGTADHLKAKELKRRILDGLRLVGSDTSEPELVRRRAKELSVSNGVKS